MSRLRALEHPTKHLFFTGKGGVGKTSLSCASAIALCDRGLRVLIVSTDPASNLDEMLGTTLKDEPTPIAAVPGLFATNIDPERAAEEYRSRVLAQLSRDAGEEERQTVREQLSGAAPPRSRPSTSSWGCSRKTKRSSTTSSSTRPRRATRSAC